MKFIQAGNCHSNHQMLGSSQIIGKIFRGNAGGIGKVLYGFAPRLMPSFFMRWGCLIGEDTIAHRKPHPPLFNPSRSTFFFSAA